MPAKSKAQRRLMAACEHGADWESCPKGMTKAQMHDFAATPEKDLPDYAVADAMRGFKKKKKKGPPIVGR